MEVQQSRKKVNVQALKLVPESSEEARTQLMAIDRIQGGQYEEDRLWLSQQSSQSKPH